MSLSTISSIVLILSGKGGVGKSSTTLQLALALTAQDKNVGILDIDLTGPSIPRLLGLEGQKITQTRSGWVPVQVYPASAIEEPTVKNLNGKSASVPSDPISETDATTKMSSAHGSLHAISLGFLLPSRSSAVIWRGPKKTAMIRQFLSDVSWPKLDYLLIDTPPGTSDEHIAVLEELHKLADRSTNQLRGALVVTTPQAVSTSDVKKELNFCVKTGVTILGVIENMSGYACPCCGQVSNVFSKGGGQLMAAENDVAFWGLVPIDTRLGAVVDAVRVDEKGEATEETDSRPMLERYRECNLYDIFNSFARKLIEPNTRV